MEPAVRELQEVPSQKREIISEQVSIKIHSTGESGKAILYISLKYIHSECILGEASESFALLLPDQQEDRKTFIMFWSYRFSKWKHTENNHKQEYF